MVSGGVGVMYAIKQVTVTASSSRWAQTRYTCVSKARVMFTAEGLEHKINTTY